MTASETPADTSTNMPYFTVAELSGAIKRTIEGQFEFVRVRGEISRPSMPASGHIYFTLKDTNVTLSAVIWKGMAAHMAVRPEEGLDVICTGKVTTFGGQSKYQIIVSQMEVAGEGALLKQLEDRRRRLAEEGLFDTDRKQPIPPLPRRIGVVTSPSGAVIRDILHRLSERFGTHVQLWGVPVQGQGAEHKIAAAIDGFNALPDEGDVAKPDVLIIARGGGSLEDLWCFNEEIVVRAVAQSRIPVISAIGHETDTTLIDYAADLRAPTPTAAAELATPVGRDLQTRILELEARLSAAISRQFDGAQTQLRSAMRGLLHPAELIGRQGQSLDILVGQLHARMERVIGERQLRLSHLADRLPAPTRQLAVISERLTMATTRLETVMDTKIDRASQTLSGLARLLQANSFERVLDRGFVLVTDKTGRTIKRAADAQNGAVMQLRFADATRLAQLDPTEEPVLETTSLPAAATQPGSTKSASKKTARKADGKNADNGQSELF